MVHLMFNFQQLEVSVTLPLCIGPKFIYRQFIAESLDVIQDVDWIISLGNAFEKQYELYSPDDEHSALLHR